MFTSSCTVFWYICIHNTMTHMVSGGLKDLNTGMQIINWTAICHKYKGYYPLRNSCHHYISRVKYILQAVQCSGTNVCIRE